ncbi:MAG TPA: cytochrome c oxidase subunit 3 [Candidatus Dormibacteraeota bacterium]|nr:cytochrome c oxidase subunit 3 [Candidatus Dormibacteraeota bacterium]
MSESGIAVHGYGGAILEQSPYAIPSRKLTIWLFIISDAVTFGALLFGYGYLRAASSDWPTPFKFSPTIVNVMIMTFVLITSSLTMLGAVESANAGDKGKARRFLWSTILFGLIFAALHIREWVALIHEGVRMFQNPWGSPLFGATFFSITGLHLLHVISGVVAIAVVSRGYSRGSLTAGHVETTGLYWHFVDLVWMFVVPLLYLLNVSR